MSAAQAEIKPLRRFLLERRWKMRVATHDQSGGPRMRVMLYPAPTQEQLQELYAKFGNAYEFTDLSVQFRGHDGPGAYNPTVGERRASTLYGTTPEAGAAGWADDALWQIEEWDGRKWLPVSEVRGDMERDRLLHQE